MAAPAAADPIRLPAVQIGRPGSGLSEGRGAGRGKSIDNSSSYIVLFVVHTTVCKANRHVSDPFFVVPQDYSQKVRELRRALEDLKYEKEVRG